MCGIAGILYTNGEKAGLDAVKRMTDSIAHRGPDGEGHWINPGARLALGHRRLSIIDLSDAASQPMLYAGGRYALTFNGEIYNYLELRGKLAAKGYVFRTSSDTEVLMALYHHFREKCLEEVDGMYAFAIWDEQEQTLFCARDRFGEKPFYYTMEDGKFFFASEMKALFAAGIHGKLSLKRLHYYLAFNLGQDPDDAASTFYENIFQLPPAHCMTIFSDGKRKINRYWKIDTSLNTDMAFGPACERFRELFSASLSRRLRADVPVGSSLSGGMDSSSIVLLIDRMKEEGQKQKTFSARFKDFAKDEGPFMEQVISKARGVESFFTWPDEEFFLSEMDKIWYHQEEPFGSASIVAQWAVMKLAKEHQVKVLIDGQGADEIICGYRPFFRPFLNKLFAERSPDYKREKKGLQEVQHYEHKLTRSAAVMLRHPRLFTMVSGLKKRFTAKPGIAREYPNELGYSDDFYSAVKQYPSPFLGEPYDNMREHQLKIIERVGFAPLLRYADRSSMAHSRELRLPFLDRQLVEFCFSLPDQYKIHDGWTKYLLRKSMEDILPASICWRRDKVGFEAPGAKWLQHPDARERVLSAATILQAAGITGKASRLPEWKIWMVSNYFSKP